MSQDVKVTLNIKNTRLDAVLLEIERQTGLVFFYSNKELDVSKPINIKARKVDAKVIIDRLFSKDYNIRYEEKYVILIPFKKKIYKERIVVKGKVFCQKTKESLIGVVIMDRSTGKGVTTSEDGFYELQIESDSTELLFRYIGMKPKIKKIKKSTILNVFLENDLNDLQEIVITALGVEQRLASVGYSVTQLDSKNLNTSGVTSFADLIVGQVPGLFISSVGGARGSSSRMVMRGNNSIAENSNNQPLFIVDGIPINNSVLIKSDIYGRFDLGDGISDINPDEIDKITFLRGSAATSLYGSRGINGVVIITTKRGDHNNGAKVSLTSSLVFDQALLFNDFQSEFGHGNEFSTPQTQEQAIQMGDRAWGLRMNGQNVMFFDGVERKYLPNENIQKDYYQTGVTTQNTVAIQTKYANSSYRLSLGTINSKTIVPNNTLEKYICSLNAYQKLNSNIELNSKLTYVFENVANRALLSDDPGNPARSFTSIPLSYSNSLLRDNYEDSNGDYVPYSSAPWNVNPYWGVNKNINWDKQNRLLGATRLKYDFYENFNLEARFGIDIFNTNRLFIERMGTPWEISGQMYENRWSIREDNFEFLLNYENHHFLDIYCTLGSTYNSRNQEEHIVFSENFKIKDSYASTNAANRKIQDKYQSKEVASVFSSIRLSHHDCLFLTITGRNDWSSTLALQNNSYFYPSVSSSIVMSKLLTMPRIINFLNFRLSYAEVGGDTMPYYLKKTYESRENVLSKNGEVKPVRISEVSSNSDIAEINSSNIKFNENLKLYRNIAYEFGSNIKMFDQRLEFDIAVYKQNIFDQVVPISVSRASGYERFLINKGEMENKGIEILCRLHPVDLKDYGVNITLNYSRNFNKVVALTDRTSEYILTRGRSENVYTAAVSGEAYGAIVGRGYLKDSEGRVIHNSSGFPMKTKEYVILGNATPDWLASGVVKFRYKRFTLNSVFDFKAGGELYSHTNSRAYTSGLHKNTIPGRDSYINDNLNGGVVGDGVTESGEINTKVVRPDLYYLYVATIAEEFVYDASYLKLSGLSLKYTVSPELCEKLKMSSLTLAITGKNICYFMKNVPNIDPNTFISNDNKQQGFEDSSLPSIRSYSIQLKMTF